MNSIDIGGIVPYSNKEKQREYYLKNREKKREYARNRYVAKSKFPSPCKEMRKKLSKEEFEIWQTARNKESIERSKKRREGESKEIIDNYKLSHPCKCGESDIGCLEFHHRDPFSKSFKISTLGRKVSKQKLLLEIQKCDILCKNCHTGVHSRGYLTIPELEEKIRKLGIELKYTKGRNPKTNLRKRIITFKTKIYVKKYKIDRQCKTCGEKNPNYLIFHHRDRATKRADVSVLCRRGIKVVKVEIDKCALLCNNCHSKLHYKEYNKSA